MGIRVLFFATLADVAGVHEITFESAELSDVNSVLLRSVRDFPALQAHRDSILFAVNSEFARSETPVHEGDEVALFPPVSGG